MALMLLVGTSSVFGGVHWQGKVYFQVPNSWDISKNSYVQIVLTQTNTVNSGIEYAYVVGTMEKISDRLYYYKIEQNQHNHSGWGNKEYIAFIANNTNWNTGDFYIDGCGQKTVPLDYECNDINNYYLFQPTSDSDKCAIEGSYGTDRNILKATQTVNIYTNGTASNSGGSVKLTGYYFNNSDTEIKQSTASSSGTSGKYDDAVIGSEMKLTATAKTGYEFEGWYDAASGGTLLSSNTSYTYNVYGAKTIYARFKQSCNNPAVPSIEINENSSATICEGSTARITIDANHEAASYKLFTKNGDIYKDEKDINNKTINVSTAGTYVVRAYNATCMTESDAVTLAVDTKPIIKVREISPICEGNEIDLSEYVSASLGTLTYNEETTSIFNPTVDTEYTIEAINGECSVTTTITVPVTRIPNTPTISSEQASICSGSQATINIEGDAKTYLLYVHDNGYTLQGKIKPDGKTFKITPKKTTTYAVKALNGESCYSNGFSNDVTINVTTTPTITGPSATQPDKEITLSSAAGANTWWETSGGTLTPETGAETVFTATENGNYTITAKNADNNITCSATHSIVVNDKFYIYIRRPKSGTTTYDQWYEKSYDEEKGAHPWMKNGSEYKTGDDYTNNNYDGYGPESTFTDCNGNIWDAFIAPGTSFFIHAPNTFQEGGQKGYATFTQVTNITSTATDLYYTINQWAGGETKGTTLSPASEPNRIPEVAVPVLSIDPVSGIICQGTEATITVTNPENGVSYKLNYEGKDQTNSIAYTGTENVKFAVTESGTYLVKAETTNGTCKGNAVSIAREIQVITTSISFEGAPYVTTPWEPITITVNIPKGYNYTFNDTQLTQIASPDTPIKKVSGSEYTYSFPRPQEWGTGNSQTGDSWGEKTYTISATLNGVTETCGTTTATVKLQDEGNDKCRTNP